MEKEWITGTAAVRYVYSVVWMDLKACGWLEERCLQEPCGSMEAWVVVAGGGWVGRWVSLQALQHRAIAVVTAVHGGCGLQRHVFILPVACTLKFLLGRGVGSVRTGRCLGC